MSASKVNAVPVFVSFRNTNDGPVRASLMQVLPIVGTTICESIEDATTVVTDDTDLSLAALKMGKSVIQLQLAGKPAPNVAAGLVTHYPGRIAVCGFLSLVADVAKALTLFKTSTALAPSFDPASFTPSADVNGRRVLLVDDEPIHRRAGQLIFGASNLLTVTASYGEALRLLSGNESFDLVLTDLLMPAEGFTLGKDRETQIGAPIAAGHFIVSRALACGVADIIMVTQGNHHADPNIAAFDHLKSIRTDRSFVSYHNDHGAGPKDWNVFYRAHTARKNQKPG